ncbi:MAG: TIGR01777 family oxidoreductase [Ignavibacteriaceae bacterium]|nr:TIGR01777 family oxidoreductase [Ignavibacteriaceae bacterium]
MNVLISGATGVVGSEIVKLLLSNGHKVFILTRDEAKSRRKFPDASGHIFFNYRSASLLTSVMEETDAVIHLAGAGIADGRWTDSYKRVILESRTLSAKYLTDSIRTAVNKPKIFISASAIGYYGDTADKTVYENSPAGKGFMAHICEEWEKSVADAESLGLRTVKVRIGVVLSPKGGALAKMVPPYKFFIGGPLGKGDQYLSWIHLRDLGRLFLRCLQGDYSGVINGTTGEPVTMNQFSKTLGRVLKRPSIFRVPSFVLNLIMGEAAEVVLGSQRVKSDRHEKAGFTPEFTDLSAALADLLNKK